MENSEQAGDATGISSQLTEISGAGDGLVHELYKLTAKWDEESIGSEAVEPILQFMESHPDLDYGSPGPLVQFVESRRHEDKLIESIERRPTFHTMWMLNRLINGAPKEKASLIPIFRRIAEDTALEPYVRERAADFFEWQVFGREPRERGSC